MFRDLLFTALGTSSTINKKLRKEIKTLQKKGNIRKKDAKEFLDEIKRRGKKEEKKLKKEIRSNLKILINELGIATKKDLEKFKNEIK